MSCLAAPKMLKGESGFDLAKPCCSSRSGWNGHGWPSALPGQQGERNGRFECLSRVAITRITQKDGNLP